MLPLSISTTILEGNHSGSGDGGDSSATDSAVVAVVDDNNTSSSIKYDLPFDVCYSREYSRIMHSKLGLLTEREGMRSIL